MTNKTQSLAQLEAALAAPESKSNTMAGFRGGFIGLHGRAPTEQEIWNAGVDSGRRRYAATDPVAEFASQQRPLDADMSKVLHDNLWGLYDAAPVPALAAPEQEPIAWLITSPKRGARIVVCDEDTIKRIANVDGSTVQPLYAAPVPAIAAPVEPVAWMFMDGDHAQTDEPTDKTYFTPLYAAPVSRVISDELREAAQDLIDSLDAYPEQLVPINRLSHTCRMLREALAKVEGK